MESHRVVSSNQWIEERKALLEREKEFTQLRDQLSHARRDLPWVRVDKDKDYVFDGAGGKQTLAELFAGRQQLIVYHLMFDPSWEEACPRCSFWADNFNGGPSPSEPAGCQPRRHLPCAIREAGGISEADGLELQLGVVFCQRL